MFEKQIKVRDKIFEKIHKIVICSVWDYYTYVIKMTTSALIRI